MIRIYYGRELSDEAVIERGNMPEAVAGVVSVSVGDRPVDERAIRMWAGFCCCDGPALLGIDKPAAATGAKLIESTMTVRRGQYSTATSTLFKTR
jgi:hypothetical protein